jgi:hypothetical protein
MRIIVVLLFCILTNVLNAQTGTYLSDLATLKSILQKTASYKAQITGERRSNFNALYHRLASDTPGNVNSYKYFYNLAQLLFPLRDNHLGFYQVHDYTRYKSKQSIDSFVTTKEFLDYPSCNINIDSLKIELAKKSVDSLEGIYHYDKYYSVGLFRKGGHELIGVVLDSDVNLWQKGQIAIHLYEYAPHLYKAIYGHPLYKSFIFQPVEKCQNQQLVNSYFYGSYSQSTYSKKLRQVDHVNLPRNASRFSFMSINDDVQYLLIKTFQADSKTALASQLFYDSIKTSLKAKNLIVDLRNNDGGAEKEMTKYLKLLKEYVKRGNLYVLLNNGTVSQAEIFALELRRLKNVTTVGQQTKGMLSYGSNYGKRERLPSGRFEMYATDMNNGSGLLLYEDYGIKPDIVLVKDRNWVEQVLEIIKNR